MKKLAVVLALALLPHLALAACTYATAAGSSTTVATCSTGTEAAPTLATEGLRLEGLAGLNIVATTATAMTAGGTFQAYLWFQGANAGAGAWVRNPDLDLTAQALTGQIWPWFTIAVPYGRIDYRPVGIGVASTIYLAGASR